MIRNALYSALALAACGSAFANTCEAPILAGAADQSVFVEFIDNTTGLPVAGLAYNGGGIDLEYVRTGAAAVDITEATQTANGAHSDGGFVSLGHGRYRLDLPDAAVASSAREVVVQGILTGYTMLPCVVALSPIADMRLVSGDAVAADNLEALFDLVVGQSGSFAPFGIKASGTAVAYTVGDPSVTLAAGETFGADVLVGNILWTRGSDQGYWQEETITQNSGDVATLEEAYAVEPTGTLSYILWGVPEVTAAEGATDWTSDERTAMRTIFGIPGSGTTPADPTDGILDDVRDGVDAVPTAAENRTEMDSNSTDLDTLVTNIAVILSAEVLASGACDSGSTLTCVDSALTQSDSDYWKGAAFVPLTGTAAFQARCITDFNTNDTLTFTPATTQAITTNTYLIVRDALCTGVAD